MICECGTFVYEYPCHTPCADPEEGWQGVKNPPPLENHLAIWFLSNTGPDPQESHKAKKPAFNIRPSSGRQ